MKACPSYLPVKIKIVLSRFISITTWNNLYARFHNLSLHLNCKNNKYTVLQGKISVCGPSVFSFFLNILGKIWKFYWILQSKIPSNFVF